MVNRKELHPEDSPRAGYGAHLRRLRERRDWTQDDLAARTSYSSQHISAVETARKPPTLPFSREADQALGTAGKADSLERLWNEMRYGSLREGFPEYVGYEGRAVEIRSFHIGIIPGLLQTPEYAQALANGDVRRGSITQQQADERVAFLMERQAALVRDRPPMLLVVMDESCIRRPIGGFAVMGAQLERLVEYAGLPNSVLQVAPYEIGERRSFDLPVNLLTLADRSMVAYAETHAQGHVDRDRTTVVSLLTAYHQLQAECLSQADSVAMIEQVRKGMS
ncbi:helix-turn-helix transcriptional regulator [Streptomyces roseicoloratus]|uniref:Helix-turn-helix transcriptional regulator n=1 Tax=Streptomyces roseicoloratus TaxID=2508722 RepID=A0ABY9RY37_9ACTN|nr:helix-turn-helix transcriptional regulator [Streptomyces roseicoloratus]WMX46892.1 helix-turn-helix transcriptional regulator [Streptomyces roseicoloratus]